MRYIYIGKASTQISHGHYEGLDDVAFSDTATAVLSIQRQVGEGKDATFEKVILGTVQELLAKALQAKAQAALTHAIETEQVVAPLTTQDHADGPGVLATERKDVN